MSLPLNMPTACGGRSTKCAPNSNVCHAKLVTAYIVAAGYMGSCSGSTAGNNPLASDGYPGDGGLSHIPNPFTYAGKYPGLFGPVTATYTQSSGCTTQEGNTDFCEAYGPCGETSGAFTCSGLANIVAFLNALDLHDDAAFPWDTCTNYFFSQASSASPYCTVQNSGIGTCGANKIGSFYYAYGLTGAGSPAASHWSGTYALTAPYCAGLNGTDFGALAQISAWRMPDQPYLYPQGLGSVADGSICRVLPWNSGTIACESACNGYSDYYFSLPPMDQCDLSSTYGPNGVQIGYQLCEGPVPGGGGGGAPCCSFALDGSYCFNPTNPSNTTVCLSPDPFLGGDDP